MKELSIAIQAKVPVLVWGSPGTGKTSYIKKLGEALNLPVEIEIGSVREPSDFGFPILKDGCVEKAPPAWAKRLVKAGKGILFLDELSTSPPAVQAAMLRIVLERVVGDTALPQAVAIVAAANPPEEAAGGWDLTAPMANRFCHLDWKVDASTWLEGFISDWPEPKIEILPSDWKSRLPKAKAKVASFINSRRQMLNVVPESDNQKGKAWPSSRSWEMAAILLAAAESVSDEDAAIRLVSGCVGSGAGIEFAAFLKNLDLPDPESLLKAPKSFILPTRGDIAYAVLSSVIAAVASIPSKERWIAAWVILSNAAAQGGKDIVIPAAKGLIQNQTFNKKGFLNRPLPPQVEVFLNEISSFIRISKI